MTVDRLSSATGMSFETATQITLAALAVLATAMLVGEFLHWGGAAREDYRSRAARSPTSTDGHR
jgi:hypothetical protein